MEEFLVVFGDFPGVFGWGHGFVGAAEFLVDRVAGSWGGGEDFEVDFIVEFLGEGLEAVADCGDVKGWGGDAPVEV